MNGGARVADTSSARYRARIGSGLYAHVVDVLGQEIIDGVIEPGTIVYADQLCDRLGVSRSVVREGIRTLSSMGLVEARPQVGTRVLPPSSWDLLNPYVVKWRGQGPTYALQMKQLLELRLGIEHAAAGLAAQRISAESAAEILERAQIMQQAFLDHDARKFFEMDAGFHRLLLEGTDNAVMAQLADTIGATLDARGHDTRPGMHDITAESVANHIRLAEALVARDVNSAQEMALTLVQRTLEEFEEVSARYGV
ncbi:transcriptional regulator [Microbacterium keratanolyticum]|uniref:Transcriptional regulator n=1 Tax=Microbacterium keratanolyticum TaxID=67574 RepID=A0A9W6HTT0_9MICO|nr:transcriptional regulator [Microbacterium keratanolyticum]